MTRDQIKAEREAFDEWWLTRPVGSTLWDVWQAALASRKPLPSNPNVADSTFVDGYGWVPTAAVRAVERAHGIGEKHE